MVLLTFASPAAPTPDGAPSPAVAWLTHFLPHLLPNDCWTPFPNSGPAHLCDWLLSLLQWQRVQWLLFENVTAIHLGNCGAEFHCLHQKEGMNIGEKNIPLWGIPAKGFSRVELMPGVVCVGTSLCAFLRKAGIPGYLNISNKYQAKPLGLLVFCTWRSECQGFGEV